MADKRRTLGRYLSPTHVTIKTEHSEQKHGEIKKWHIWVSDSRPEVGERYLQWVQPRCDGNCWSIETSHWGLLGWDTPYTHLITAKDPQDPTIRIHYSGTENLGRGLKLMCRNLADTVDIYWSAADTSWVAYMELISDHLRPQLHQMSRVWCNGYCIVEILYL